MPTVRQITKGPKFHWFGYYDKLEFDQNDRYVLANQVDFQNKTPDENDNIKIGMVDLKNDDEWIELNETNAWSWQQGCMLQWLPKSNSKIIYNDRGKRDHFVCHILDVCTGEKRTVEQPIYSIHHSGKFAVTTDFRRIQD